jgi:AraC family transcriptional regulator, glycine betaine-responsive activator
MRVVGDQQKEWVEMAHRANYSASELAVLCGVSVRQLEREFQRTIYQSPKRWLNQLRLCAARKLLHEGGSVKEAALTFGYKHPQHFSRDFRKFFGVPPSEERTAQSGRYNPSQS